jgi:hypothetical protein
MTRHGSWGEGSYNWPRDDLEVILRTAAAGGGRQGTEGYIEYSLGDGARLTSDNLDFTDLNAIDSTLRSPPTMARGSRKNTGRDGAGFSLRPGVEL